MRSQNGTRRASQEHQIRMCPTGCVLQQLAALTDPESLRQNRSFTAGNCFEEICPQGHGDHKNVPQGTWGPQECPPGTRDSNDWATTSCLQNADTHDFHQRMIQK